MNDNKKKLTFTIKGVKDEFVTLSFGCNNFDRLVYILCRFDNCYYKSESYIYNELIRISSRDKEIEWLEILSMLEFIKGFKTEYEVEYGPTYYSINFISDTVKLEVTDPDIVDAFSDKKKLDDESLTVMGTEINKNIYYNSKTMTFKEDIVNIKIKSLITLLMIFIEKDFKITVK